MKTHMWTCFAAIAISLGSVAASGGSPPVGVEAAPPATGAQPAQTPTAPESPKPPPDWISRLEIGAVSFLNYRYESTEGADDFNTFDVTRMYFFSTFKPTEHLRFRMTLDAANREATTTVKDGVATVRENAGKYDIVLKHAFMEVFDVGAKGLSLKLGMHDLPWVPFEEKIWTYRFQGTTFADREGYLSSTDLGAGLGYVRPNKRFEVHAAFVNGETWSKPEVSRHKDVHGRVTLRPVGKVEGGTGFSMSAFGSAGLYEDGEDRTRNRLILQAAYQHKHATLAADYLQAWDPPGKLRSRHPSLAGSTDAVVTGHGVSVFGWLDLGMFGGKEGLRLVGRAEWLDPDTNLKANAHKRFIVGVGYKINKYVNTLLDAEFVDYDEDAGVATDERRVFFHVSLNF